MINIYFYEGKSNNTLCNDGRERFVGGVVIPGRVWGSIQSETVDWSRLPEESTISSLAVGNIVGVKLGEVGRQTHPYVVADIDTSPTENENMDDVSYVIILENLVAEIDTIAIYQKRFSGFRAYYKHEPTSRHITGDSVSVYPVPDVILADLLDADELKSKLVSKRI